MKLLSDKYLLKYKKIVWDIFERYNLFLEKSEDLNFNYLTQTSSVFSSNIEWNTIDINSFMNFKINKIKSKDIEEIDNLIMSYEFAQNNKLNEKNFLETHKISSETLLIKSKRWKYRNDKVWVFWNEWLIYLAIEAEYVEEKMKDLFSDIDILLNSDLTLEEIFYYSSMIHLVFVHIHPFADWNGRSARLLEKWFLSEKLWKQLWKMKSEEFYNKYRDDYYKNINLWVNYYELDYNNCTDFLMMLLNSLDN